VAFTWGAVCRPKQGQNVSGDTYVIREQDAHTLFVAVIDGLGGGEEAAKAARAAENVINEHVSWPLQEIMRLSHTALQGTRGAVISLLRLDEVARHADYVGVGNIGAHVYSRQPIKPITKSGIVGFRMPPTMLELHYQYDPGDVFVLYSDGISSRFGQTVGLNALQSPQQFAEDILTNHGKTVDDSTVVVVQTHA
jgi:serine phosphatase RsbU (regulator of sigma subunit)